ncbi:MAG TPA: quinolinate synthase NadA [Desulfobulbus sp.]|nr:quinolinate synthase NadA [Desulfobulbus sp.]HHD64229.1 quinolinate synthase NadA [Desulfobulbaceae bacterium]
MPILRQIDIGSQYYAVEEDEILARIARRKRQLADRLLILGHHYQQDNVYRFADLSGDSLKLSREAAAIQDREFLVFCGVHFMAEAADILAADNQKVLLPHLDAGCPMADMSTRSAIAAAWEELRRATGLADADITPVTYVNSSAEVKAFVGEHGGSVCTSSNANKVLKWALDQGRLVFFFPDQHLGRNASWMLEVPDKRVILWRRGEPFGGNDAVRLKQARVVLWDGYCEVHMRIFPEHVSYWRATAPEAKIIVHPECRNEIVRAADLSGSTEGIIKAVSGAEKGSQWVIGTEINLVRRLASEHPDKSIRSLTPGCLCPTMDVITPVNLLWILDNLAEGRVVNQIRVDAGTAFQAKKSLNRMLSI